jgi:hypothetical protein
VRINIPLLPVCIKAGEVRWRSLPPPRLTLLGMILVVAIAALFLCVGAESVRLHNIGSYHAIETSKVASIRYSSRETTRLRDWHFRMSKDYHSAAERKEAILDVMLKLLVTLGMVAALGRVIHWLFRRRIPPSRE